MPSAHLLTTTSPVSVDRPTSVTTATIPMYLDNASVNGGKTSSILSKALLTSIL